VTAAYATATILAAIAVLCPPPITASMPPTPPVADAGPDRYADWAPIRLDGSGSRTGDGDPITDFEWFQISGPAVVISDPHAAAPEIDGITQTVFIQTVEIGLKVGDGGLVSEPDIVRIVIVPSMSHRSLELINPPFRPELPTLITFGGGDCVDGGPMRLEGVWRDRFNIITGWYFHPYADHAYQVMVMLSEMAPEYDQAIQTIGFSTGGNPASRVANIINGFFPDPRYAVHRMTILDAYCDDNLDREVAIFRSNPVAGEPAWAEVYRSAPEPIPGAFNVSFHPGGDHNTPLEWFVDSADPLNWPDEDPYNGGVTAGFFLSVGGPGRNLRLEIDDLRYYLECPHVSPDCLRPVDPDAHPGLVLEPVALIGPEHGATARPGGEILSCEPSRHAIRYELLLGPGPDELQVAVGPSPAPPVVQVVDLPFEPTYWTIRAQDEFGSSDTPIPRALWRGACDPVRRNSRRVVPDP
jgi:hypothetical protein